MINPVIIVFMDLGSNFTARLILAIVTTVLEEFAIYALWRWGLPRIDVQLPVYTLVIGMVIWAGFSVTTFILGTHALRRKVTIGLPSMIGSSGKVAKAIMPANSEGLVSIRGELWLALAEEGISAGELVEVVGQEGLKLSVRRKDILAKR